MLNLIKTYLNVYFQSQVCNKLKTAQHSVPHDHRDKYAPDPRKSTETTLAPHVVSLANHAGVVVGVGAFSSSLRGFRMVPAKWRPLVPPTSPHQGATRRVTPAVGHH